MKTTRTHWLLFANMLWWFHCAIVMLVGIGFLGQFFVPALVPFEFALMGIVVVFQFLWLGKCPCTELERFFHIKAGGSHEYSKDGCMVETILACCGVRIRDSWISIAGICAFAVTTAMYIL